MGDSGYRMKRWTTARSTMRVSGENWSNGNKLLAASVRFCDALYFDAINVHNEII